MALAEVAYTREQIQSRVGALAALERQGRRQTPDNRVAPERILEALQLPQQPHRVERLVERCEPLHVCRRHDRRGEEALVRGLRGVVLPAHLLTLAPSRR